MRETVSWVIMAFIGIFFIVMGFEGALGKILACLVTPSEVVVNG